MSRFAPQSDLFPTPAPPETPTEPLADPLAELTALLALARGADRLPWPNLGAVIREHCAQGLGRLAGAEGQAVAAEFLVETERLLAMTD